jgi:hypothetical protein
MITLLLSFFVMLATFSSFSKERLDKLEGVFDYMSNYSVWPSMNVTQESVAPQDRYVDRTMRGSEKPASEGDLGATRNPNPSQWSKSEAYRDQRTFYIPSSKLFWAEGANMMPSGKGQLDKIASYLKLLPGPVVVGESNPSGVAADRGLERAWAIVEYCRARSGLPPERFSICQLGSQAAKETGGEPMIEVTLMTRSPLP